MELRDTTSCCPLSQNAITMLFFFMRANVTHLRPFIVARFGLLPHA